MTILDITLTTLLLLFLFHFMAISITPTKLLNRELAYGLGAAWIVFSCVLVSSVFQTSVRSSLLVVLFLSFLLLSFRLMYSQDFRNVTLFFSKKFMPINFLAALFPGMLFQFLDIDLGARNFDAYQAAQDANFLSSNPYIQSSPSQRELLPLNWSAPIHGRYGVSIFLVFFKLFGYNPFVSLQVVYFVLLALLGAVTRSVMKELLDVGKIPLAFATLFTFLLPHALLQSTYFMFGQVLGMLLALTFLNIFLMRKFLTDFRLFNLSLILIAICFLAYPPISFPLIFFLLLMLFMTFIKEKKSLGWLLKWTSYSGITFCLALVLLYGFQLNKLLEIIRIWVGHNIGVLDDQAITQIFDLNFFGQWTSNFTPLLSLGSLTYPVIADPSNVVTFVLTGLSFIFLFFIIKVFVSLELDKTMLSILTVYSISWLVFLCGAFFMNSSYVFLKFVLWNYPIAVVVLTLTCREVFGVQIISQSRIRHNFSLKIIFLIQLSLMINVSSQYLYKIEEWNSFGQVPSPRQYSQLVNFGKNLHGDYALVKSTAEEAMWTTGVMDLAIGSNIYSLGASSQALGAALENECPFSKVQSRFSEISGIIIDEITKDVVPRPIFAGKAIVQDSLLSVFDSKQLNSIAIVKSGLFPPEDAIQSSNENEMQVSRWSAGSICLSFFSSKRDDFTFSIPVIAGLGLSKTEYWKVTVGKQSVSHKFDKVNKVLSFRVSAKSGWQDVLISNSSCYENKSRSVKWSEKADDRPLCFLVNPISIDSQKDVIVS